MIRTLSTWRHSDFHVFCGNRISPADDTAMEHLARTLIRESLSQERMQHLDLEGKVAYASFPSSSNRLGMKKPPAELSAFDTEDLRYRSFDQYNQGIRHRDIRGAGDAGPAFRDP